MHEGLTVDPRTGFDEGPRLGRWIPSMKVLTSIFGVLWLLVAFGPLAHLPWLLPLLILTMCGAVPLVLGLEARVLARCTGADTSASRELRWERAVMFGTIGLLGALGFGAFLVGLERFSPSLVGRVLLGIAGSLGLAALLVGLILAWRHRPDSVGFAEQSGPSQRR